jgi:hypothetical protein
MQRLSMIGKDLFELGGDKMVQSVHCFCFEVRSRHRRLRLTSLE